MPTYPVEVYIYELSEESQTWCYDQFRQILTNEEEVLHSSVVVHGVEYSYGENGIEEQEPKLRPQYLSDDFEEAASWTKTIGKTKLTSTEVNELVSKLRKGGSWFSYRYNPIEHNCHHFTKLLVKLLCGNEVTLPSEINEFNEMLVSYRESWIDNFYGNEESDKKI